MKGAQMKMTLSYSAMLLAVLTAGSFQRLALAQAASTDAYYAGGVIYSDSVYEFDEYCSFPHLQIRLDLERPLGANINLGQYDDYACLLEVDNTYYGPNQSGA